jgi:IS4 transposase
MNRVCSIFAQALQLFPRLEFQELVRETKAIRRDEVIELGSHHYRQAARFRRIEVWVEEKQETMVLLSNHLEFGSTTIAAIYRERWQIEVFFRHLKQNLRIKIFVGTSANALHIQIAQH